MNSKSLKTKMAEGIKAAATKVATHYANVTCPLLTYQPKMSNEVKKLRKNNF